MPMAAVKQFGSTSSLNSAIYDISLQVTLTAIGCSRVVHGCSMPRLTIRGLILLGSSGFAQILPIQ